MILGQESTNNNRGGIKALRHAQSDFLLCFKNLPKLKRNWDRVGEYFKDGEVDFGCFPFPDIYPVKFSQERFVNPKFSESFQDRYKDPSGPEGVLFSNR